MATRQSNAALRQPSLDAPPSLTLVLNQVEAEQSVDEAPKSSFDWTKVVSVAHDVAFVASTAMVAGFVLTAGPFAVCALANAHPIFG